MEPTKSPTASSELPVAGRLVAAHWDSLWITGDPTALEPPLVAIVGTREADLHGLALAREFAGALAKEGISVLSGGALGIDAAAHTGALESGGRTAVVLPSGFDNLYPLRHKRLYEHIIQKGGALVSPFPPHTPPARWTFPKRNYLLAALCDLLLVVQAPAASGSLITAEAARQLGRRILVVPASPGDPRGTGCLKLLRMGAEMCSSPADIMAALAHRDGPLQAHAHSHEPIRERTKTQTETPSRARSRTRTRAPEPARATHVAPSSQEGVADRDKTWALDDTSRSVYSSLGSAPQHLDEISQINALPAARVRSILLSLVLLGLAEDRGNGTFLTVR